MQYPTNWPLCRDQNKNLGGRKGFRVDFTKLQRMHLRKLQIKLIRHGASMANEGKEPTKPERDEGNDEDGNDDDGNDKDGNDEKFD